MCSTGVLLIFREYSENCRFYFTILFLDLIYCKERLVSFFPFALSSVRRSLVDEGNTMLADRNFPTL
jgi:hypothetical protein